MFDKEGYCPRCAKKINSEKSTWLELSFATNRYGPAGSIPPSESQGWFEFGSDCAKSILKNQGELVCVGVPKR